jgi:hypothetical protein
VLAVRPDVVTASASQEAPSAFRQPSFEITTLHSSSVHLSVGGYSVCINERCNRTAMHGPPLPHTRAPFADGGDVVVGHRYVEDRARPDDGRGLKVRPFADARGELLQERCDGWWREASFEDEIQTGEMNINRLVRMTPSGVLDRVGVNR